MKNDAIQIEFGEYSVRVKISKWTDDFASLNFVIDAVLGHECTYLACEI